jgi:hypothetical protein
MKRIGLLISACLLSLIGYSQTDTTWKTGGNFNLQFSQAAYSNWQAGGTNSVTTNGLVSLFANYEKGKWAWKNQLDMAYGLSFQESVYNKTDDRLELNSRVDRSFRKHWSFSGIFNFRTQFTNGYSEPGTTEDSLKVSGLFAPAYTQLGLGFTYKPNEKFDLFLSPLTAKFTIVNDTRLSTMGAFGVEPGEKFRGEGGASLNATYKTEILKNVKMQSRLGLFSNYLENAFQFVDVNGEVLFFLKVNKYISANVSFNLIYDHDVKFDTNNDGNADAPRTQFKEVIGVGFVYDFGDVKN